MERITTKLFVVGSKLNPAYRDFFHEADEIFLERVKCSFKYRESPESISFYHPTHGDHGTLGISVPLKGYSFEELKTLAGDGRVVLIYDRYTSGGDIFDMEEMDKRVDFPATITQLENRGVIRTRPSESWLATDERAFSFGEIDDHGEEIWWQVDILGTQFGQDQTGRVFNLYTG